MALDGTYTGLKASVADFLNRADLTSAIPDFIVLAEAQMYRRLIGRQRQGLPIPRRMIGRDTSTVSEDDEYIAVPSDYGASVTFTLDSDPITVLDYLQSENLRAKKAENCRTGAPVWYTLVGSEFQLYPVADQAYTAELTYIKRLPAISASNQSTNWIFQNYPDAYLYGALVQSAPYLKDDSRITTWGTLFTAALEDICNADPEPSDKSTLRSETALLGSYSGLYNVMTDS